MMTFVLSASAFKAITVKSIKLDKSSITLEIGKTYKLNVTLIPANTTQKFLIFSTNNKKIATVDGKGKITAIKAGKAVITVASASNKKVIAKCNVTILQPKVPETKVNKIVDIIWYVMGTEKQAGDVDTMLKALNPILHDKIGVNLVLKVIDNASFNEKMTMIINSNQYYDLCWTSNWRNDFNANVCKGAFLEISKDLLQANALDLVSRYPSEYIDFGRVNGKLYAILNTQSFANPFGILVQTEMLKKYKFNLDAVKDFDDMIPFLKQVSENEKNVWALQGAPASNLQGVFFPLLDTETINNFAAISNSDRTLTVYPYYEMKDWKENTARLNKWKQYKFFRPDIATVTDDLADRNANKYVCTFSNLTPGFDVEWSSRQGIPYSMKVLTEPKMSYNAGIGTMNAISVNSKHSDKALQLLNLTHTNKEIFNYLDYGVENIHYTKVANNVVNPIDGAKYNMSQLGWQFGNNFLAYALKGQDPNMQAENEKRNLKAKKSIISGFSFDPAPVQNNLAQLTAVMKEYSRIEYRDDYDKKFEEMVAKYKAAGIDKFVAEVQKQLNAWAAAVGLKK
jgi:Bacterial surface proteins containing Ig-like domains